MKATMSEEISKIVSCIIAQKTASFSIASEKERSEQVRYKYSTGPKHISVEKGGQETSRQRHIFRRARVSCRRIRYKRAFMKPAMRPFNSKNSQRPLSLSWMRFRTPVPCSFNLSVGKRATKTGQFSCALEIISKVRTVSSAHKFRILVFEWIRKLSFFVILNIRICTHLKIWFFEYPNTSIWNSMKIFQMPTWIEDRRLLF